MPPAVIDASGSIPVIPVSTLGNQPRLERAVRLVDHDLGPRRVEERVRRISAACRDLTVGFEGELEREGLGRQIVARHMDEMPVEIVSCRIQRPCKRKRARLRRRRMSIDTVPNNRVPNNRSLHIGRSGRISRDRQGRPVSPGRSRTRFGFGQHIRPGEPCVLAQRQVGKRVRRDRSLRRGNRCQHLVAGEHLVGNAHLGDLTRETCTACTVGNAPEIRANQKRKGRFRIEVNPVIGRCRKSTDQLVVQINAELARTTVILLVGDKGDMMPGADRQKRQRRSRAIKVDLRGR